MKPHIRNGDVTPAARSASSRADRRQRKREFNRKKFDAARNAARNEVFNKAHAELNKDVKGKPRPLVEDYSEELATVICDLVASGMTLTRIAQFPGMPAPYTVYRMFDAYPEFKEQYKEARERQVQQIEEEIKDIADDGRNDTYINDMGQVKTDWDVLGRSKLRIETRRWLLQCLRPHVFGEKRTNINLPGEAPPLDEERIKQLSDKELTQLVKICDKLGLSLVPEEARK